MRLRGRHQVRAREGPREKERDHVEAAAVERARGDLRRRQIMGMLMKMLETTSVVDLPDRRVALCGDWHGDVDWLRTVRHAVQVTAPDVTTVLQLGDWWMDPDASDAVFAGSGIDRVYVTLGNHEPWPEITPLLDAHPGQAIRVSEVTWLLPRPARLRIGGRDILSLGCAASVDREWRMRE